MRVILQRIRRQIGGLFVAALVLTLSLLLGTPHAHSQTTTSPGEILLLGLRINGVDKPDAVQAVRLPQGLAVPRDAWLGWQLKPTNRAPLVIEGIAHEMLADSYGLKYRIEEATQMLVIEAPPASFSGGRYAVSNDAAPVVAARTFGGYLNYDTQWQESRYAGASLRSSFALLDLGAFAEGGYGNNTGFVRQDSNGTRWTRLDTGWNIDRPESMTSWRLGDAVSQSGTWGRSVRYGGVQWGTNFATRPGFLSFPLPSLRGEAALPSTLDLFINNTQRYQSNVPPGPFELSQLPIVTGQGQIRMVVKDLLGREQVVVQPYYVSPALLRPGLHSYAVDVGTLREDYGVSSTAYGQAIVSAMDRVGVSERFTRELRVEAMRDQQTLGGSGTWLFPSFGTVNLALAASRRQSGNNGVTAANDNNSGGMLSFGAEHQASDWSGSVQVRGTQRGFTQLGQSSFDTPRVTSSVAFGTTLGRGSVSASYVKQTSYQGENIELVSLSWGRDLGRLGYLGIFALRDLGASRGTSIAMNLTYALDAQTSAGVNTTRNRDAYGTAHTSSLQVQRNAPAGPGFGYQITAEDGSTDRYQGLATWNTEKASFQAGASRSGQMTDYRAGASGGLAWVGDSVHVSRRIDGSFAVVDISDYPGVRVLQDNQPVARTDERGRALVTGLRGYQRNRISVDPSDLPFDAEVDALAVTLTPLVRSGMQVIFPVQRARAATFRLMREDGTPVPAGSNVSVAGRARNFPVGFDGMGFASGLKPENTLIARWGDQQCEARLELKGGDDDDVPELGTLVCRKVPTPAYEAAR